MIADNKFKNRVHKFILHSVRCIQLKHSRFCARAQMARYGKKYPSIKITFKLKNTSQFKSSIATSSELQRQVLCKEEAVARSH